MQNPTKTYTDKNETGCCPVPNIADWDESEVVWEDKLFLKDSTFGIFHMPINMGSVIKRMWTKIEKAEAAPSTDEWMLLSLDVSPWKGEHYATITKDVPDGEVVKLSGTFLTKVFEGPYQDAKKWYLQMEEYVRSKGKKAGKIYFFYTTCPKCYKHYGKNYAIALAEVV